MKGGRCNVATCFVGGRRTGGWALRFSGLIHLLGEIARGGGVLAVGAGSGFGGGGGAIASFFGYCVRVSWSAGHRGLVWDISSRSERVTIVVLVWGTP